MPSANNANKRKAGKPKQAGKRNAKPATTTVVVRQPPPPSDAIRYRPPTFYGGGGRMGIRHREKVGDYKCNWAPGMSFPADSDARLVINPANSHVFPWLASLAVMFDKWKAHRIRFEWIGYGSVTTPFSVMLSYDPDGVYDGVPPDPDQLMSTEGAVQSKAASCVDLNVPVRAMHSTAEWLYVEQRSGQAPAPDLRLQDGGEVRVVVVGTVPISELDAMQGALWVTYDIEFMSPQVASDTSAGDIGASNVSRGIYDNSGENYYASGLGTVDGGSGEVTGRLGNIVKWKDQLRVYPYADDPSVVVRKYTFLRPWQGIVRVMAQATGTAGDINTQVLPFAWDIPPNERAQVQVTYPELANSGATPISGLSAAVAGSWNVIAQAGQRIAFLATMATSGTISNLVTYALFAPKRSKSSNLATLSGWTPPSGTSSSDETDSLPEMLHQRLAALSSRGKPARTSRP